MLRSDPLPPVSAGAARPGPSPTLEECYATEERPPGIAFYKGKESFFLPYALLESMRFQAEKITLLFAPAQVIIEGRGLHRLYAQLTGQKVSRIMEQGERYEETADSSVFVRRIEEVPRSRKAKAPGSGAESD